MPSSSTSSSLLRRSAGEPVKAGAACQVAVAAVAGRRAPDGGAQKRLLQGVATRLGGRHPLHGDLQGPELALRQAEALGELLKTQLQEVLVEQVLEHHRARKQGRTAGRTPTARARPAPAA